MMAWKRALVAAAIVLPILALLAFGMTRNPNVIPSPLPGRDAPGFQLITMPLERDDATETVDLAALRGNVVVLNFWASWCLACRDEHAPLSRVARQYDQAGEPVRFFGVVYNDSPENARRWIETMGGQAYPALLDPEARTAIDYGLYGVPETFIIGTDGKVRHKIIGPATEGELRSRIDALLAEHRRLELPVAPEHPLTEST